MLKRIVGFAAVALISFPLAVLSAPAGHGKSVDNRHQSQLLLAEKKANLRVRLTASLVCLARNIYFEAGIESKQGKIAVANVTINRVKSKYYPDNVCEVVYQQGPNGCAFSWTCDSKGDIPPADTMAYEEAVEIARKALAGNLQDITGKSDHYHATYTRPDWRMEMAKMATIGQHIFYRKFSG